MPTQKDLKRLVRARMQKTGEAYTAARRQLLSHKTNPAPVATAAPLPAALPQAPAPTDYARLAGMSDAALKAKTGCTWEKWVYVLDKAGAASWPHREIAQYVHEKYKVPSWWTQTVTVGYERIKGLRAIGQRRGGDYEAHKSKTFALPLARLYRAFSDKRLRAHWLPGVSPEIRTAVRNKSMRVTWPDGTRVEFYFLAKGRGKSSVAVQHVGLKDKAAATAAKKDWEGRLAELERWSLEN